MILVSDRPCNGVDLSHWNSDFVIKPEQTWFEFFGHKATHPSGNGMLNGMDPKFAVRRSLARRLDFRWRAFYAYLVPTTTCRPVRQVELLSRVVGPLSRGESVYLDWEDANVTIEMVEEISVYMNVEFRDRWFMYVNDVTEDMKSWLEGNRISELPIPVMHPNYALDTGLFQALRWNAMIWQTGQGQPPGFDGLVPIDYVLRPDLLDWVCARS